MPLIIRSARSVRSAPAARTDGATSGIGELSGSGVSVLAGLLEGLEAFDRTSDDPFMWFLSVSELLAKATLAPEIVN